MVSLPARGHGPGPPGEARRLSAAAGERSRRNRLSGEEDLRDNQCTSHALSLILDAVRRLSRQIMRCPGLGEAPAMGRWSRECAALLLATRPLLVQDTPTAH